jgi:glycerate 2-kinase
LSKAHALRIFRAALRAADPAAAVSHHLKVEAQSLIVGATVGAKRYRLSAFDRIRVIGAGKATARMAQAVEHLLGARITDGAINVPDGASVRLRKVVQQEAGHPVPDERGVEGARRIERIAAESGARDLVLCLISGGASALMPLPAPSMTLARKKSLTKALLACGATIHEINTVRKHVSAIKGGHLARLAHPATLVTLILSDVIGDNLDVIGSGPTVPDPTTCDDAREILMRYGIPEPSMYETPKPGDPIFRRVKNVIIGSNRLSMTAAATEAKHLGYRPVVLSTTIDGETRDIARMHAAIAREWLWRRERRICFLSGGETTVTLRGRGLGGRNQEFVLAALEALQGTKGVTIFSAGTDGIDGPTDAAGAAANTNTPVNLDPRPFLANNDSYHYFEKAGGLIKTGPTGTNVMDVRMLLI